jgi:hypothetical protein
LVLPAELTLYAISKVTSYESGEELGLTSQSATETVASLRDEMVHQRWGGPDAEEDV